MSHFEWADVDINAGNTVIGIISNIDYENLTADVEEIGSAIPIHYHCDEDAIEDSGKSFDIDYPDEQDEMGASAFVENDEVVVMYRRVNNEDPVIVGFADEAKACAVGGLFSIVYRHNEENYYLTYDPVSRELEVESEDGRGDEYYCSPAYRSIGNLASYNAGVDMIIASFYDWNDSIWIINNRLKWVYDPYVHLDHAMNSGFRVFSIPGETFNISTGEQGVFLGKDYSDPDSVFIGRFYSRSLLSYWDRSNQWQEVKYAWTHDDEDPSGDYYQGISVTWRLPTEHWISRKWEIENFSSGDWSEGGGDEGDHLPVKGWYSYLWHLLYEHSYSSTEWDYGPYYDITSQEMSNRGFARPNVISNDWPGSEPEDDFSPPLIIPLSSQVWYGCCSSIVGIINCRPDADCGYPGGPLHCSGSYCPSFTCQWHYSEDANWGFDWRSSMEVYDSFTSYIGESKDCNAHWEATPWQRVKIGSAPFECPQSQSYANPPTGLIMTSQTCNFIYDHTKSIFFDTTIPIMLVIDNPSGSGTQEWQDGDLVFTSGTSSNDYYSSLLGTRDATLYIKNGSEMLVQYPCEVNLTSLVSEARGNIILGGKIFVAWGSSGKTAIDSRNDHTLVYYDIPGDKRFICNGRDVTSEIINSISNLEFMEGGMADINNVNYVSARFSPSIALLRGQ